MFVPMPDNVELSRDIPGWVKFAIADAIIIFGRIEQEAIEICWCLTDADLKTRLQFAREPATGNFISIIELFEGISGGSKLDALKRAFTELASARNLIVHGAWNMANNRPWVVWHKFAEDTDSIIGEYFDEERFRSFQNSGLNILDMLSHLHNSLESTTDIRTSAIPR